MIGGYTDPAGSRTDFGALLVGYYEDGRLRYAGKVGTGYTAATLRDLGARLRELETPESPFVDARPIPRGTHWVRPELVAQIGFAEWTNDGRLRQPRFLGLRDDKRPGRGRPGAAAVSRGHGLGSEQRPGATPPRPLGGGAGAAARGGPADGGTRRRRAWAGPRPLFDGLPSDLWGALVLQVIGQQLSLAAAAAILNRLEALAGRADADTGGAARHRRRDTARRSGCLTPRRRTCTISPHDSKTAVWISSG